MIRETRSKKWSEGIEQMNRALEREGIHNPVIEIFSPPRVNGLAYQLGMSPGLSLDNISNFGIKAPVLP